MSLINTLTIFAAEAASSAEGGGHGGEEASGLSALGIDPIAILAQTATFLVLFWIVKRFALDKIVQTLNERHKTIDDGVRLGRKMEAEEAKLEERVEKELAKARDESDKIIADARKEHSEILKQAQENASEKVDQMIADAHAKIDEDIKAAKKGLEDDMRRLVAEATEIVLQEKLDEKKDESLLHKALSSVGVRR